MSQLPAKAHYATLAMLALAEKYELREPLPARVISREQNIPSQFLTQILQQLRASGMISSTRGANGGFLLESDPADVSIADILDVICPASAACSIGARSGEAASGLGEVVQDVWEQLRLKQREVLQAITLGELLKRETEVTPMFYI